MLHDDVRKITTQDQHAAKDYVESKSDTDKEFSPIPVFSRIRHVSMDCTQTMSCSCNHFERTGLPCVHQACVATYCHQFASNSPSVFKGFTHHDISVWWWSSYMYFAYKSSTPPEMVHKFHALAVKDIMGPKLRCHICLSLIPIVDPHKILPAIERIKNYPKDAICLSDVSKTSVSQSSRVHLSQTNSELFEDELLSNIADNLQHGSTGHLDDLFSDSIMNANFPLCFGGYYEFLHG